MPDDTTTPTRSALREAIAARASARAKHQAAIDARSRADDMLVDLEGELERHAQTSEAAEAQRAAEIANAIKRGGKPNVSLSKVAQEARQAQADIASRQSMAQAARATLATELVAAESALAAAERAVLRAAAGVIGSEAVETVAAFQRAQAQMFAAFDAIVSLDAIGVNLPPRTALPPWPAVVQRSLFDFAAIAPAIDAMRPVTILSNGPRAAASAKWRAYLAALATDADATLADVGDPELPREAPLHAFAPAPITREQPWAATQDDLSKALAAPRAVIA